MGDHPYRGDGEPALEADAAFDVFLSYNRRDQEVVERIAAGLRRAGIRPWFDTWTTTPGGAWQDEIDRRPGAVGHLRDPDRPARPRRLGPDGDGGRARPRDP